MGEILTITKIVSQFSKLLEILQPQIMFFLRKVREIANSVTLFARLQNCVTYTQCHGDFEFAKRWTLGY